MMITSRDVRSPPGGDDARIHEIVRSGPSGAIAVAGVSTAIVIALWFAFYIMVFLPRAPA
jgi:hypothetical protein